MRSRLQSVAYCCRFNRTNAEGVATSGPFFTKDEKLHSVERGLVDRDSLTLIGEANGVVMGSGIGGDDLPDLFY